jgi:hypothetical protein
MLIAGVCLAGIVALGGPAWAVLHRMGMRRLSHAAALGLLLGFVVNLGLDTHGFGVAGPDDMVSADGISSHSVFFDPQGVTMINGVLTAHGWWIAVESSALIGLCSALGGAAVWYVAYRWRRNERAG